jgi:hypothetical protein
MRCVATRCAALQQGALRCNRVRCVATGCAALQQGALRCNRVCCVATGCAALQQGALRCVVQAVDHRARARTSNAPRGGCVAAWCHYVGGFRVHATRACCHVVRLRGSPSRRSPRSAHHAALTTRRSPRGAHHAAPTVQRQLCNATQVRRGVRGRRGRAALRGNSNQAPTARVEGTRSTPCITQR